MAWKRSGVQFPLAPQENPRSEAVSDRSPRPRHSLWGSFGVLSPPRRCQVRVPRLPSWGMADDDLGSMSTKDAAARLEITSRTVYRSIDAGELSFQGQITSSKDASYTSRQRNVDDPPTMPLSTVSATYAVLNTESP